MELTKKVPTTDKSQENNHLLRMLDRGIDDMEAVVNCHWKMLFAKSQN